MIEIRWKPSLKQLQAFDYLTDKETTELLYGGGAGGGKSYLGCVWLIYMCLHYPGTRYLMGRAILKTLKESTLLTFFRACKQFGLTKDRDYKYNNIAGLITFSNESEIYLKDLFPYPSDPEFDELGSTEFTGAFIDEASQVSPKAYQIVMSRLRFKLAEYDLIPKLLTCTNPTKNFLYGEFYKAYKEGTLLKHRKFVPALVDDNPYMPGIYKENLMKLDRISKERLLFGNWEYDDDPAKLFEYDKLLDMFTNPFNPTIRPNYYLTVDVARMGNDKTVIILWNNLYIEKIWAFEKKPLDFTEEQITKAATQYNIPRSNIIIDEDGVGGGVVDHLKGVKGFVNNSSPLDKTGEKTFNFKNLKSQCYFYLADHVNTGKIGINPEVGHTIKQLIIEDLEQVKRHNADKDMKLEITPKEEIKEHIGRSPDFGDAIMMRMYFTIKPPYIPYLSALSKPNSSF